MLEIVFFASDSDEGVVTSVQIVALAAARLESPRQTDFLISTVTAVANGDLSRSNCLRYDDSEQE